MINHLLKQFSAMRHSKDFSALLSGAFFTMGDEKVIVKLKESVQVERPPGYRFSKFSFRSTVSLGPIQGYGYGEDDIELCALQKSIAEAIEHAFFYRLREVKPSLNLQSSSGWAAHLNHRASERNAVKELLERDGVLIHWLKRTPMTVIDLASLSRQLRKWIDDELSQAQAFNTLKVLVSERGFVPTITTVLLDSEFSKPFFEL
jgi:hypothetical protein